MPAPKKSSAKWWVLGCGGCLGVIVLGAAGFVAFIFFVVTTAIKSTDAYTDAKNRAMESPQVRAAIGEPITEGTMFGGNVSNVNGKVSADFKIPLEGPNGKADVIVVGTKESDSSPWEYSVLHVVLPDGTKVDLKQTGTPAP
jgi:hypothetical protein